MDRYGEHSFLYQHGMTKKFPSWKSSLSPPSMPLSAGEKSSYNKENQELSQTAAEPVKKQARPLQWKNGPAFFPFFLHQPAPSKGFLSTKEKNYEYCHCPAHQRNL